MKKLYVSILVSALLLGMVGQPVRASDHWSPATMQLIARQIVSGQRPPLSATELARLDDDSKRYLLAALQAERAVAKPGSQTPPQPPAPAGNDAQVDPATHQGADDSPDQDAYPQIQADASQAAFIKRLAPLALAAGRAHDLYPSVLLAQAALESNWGRSSLSRLHHNLFGIKAGPGLPAISMPTQEEVHGQLQKKQALFRTYPNWQAAVDDYAAVLSQPLYAGVHRRHCPTYRDATRALAGKYATDSHYDRKLNALIQSYGLEQYDQLPTAPARPAAGHHPVARHHQPSPVRSSHQEAARPVDRQEAAWAWPVLGGCGSVGLWQLIRRRWF